MANLTVEWSAWHTEPLRSWSWKVVPTQERKPR